MNANYLVGKDIYFLIYVRREFFLPGTKDQIIKDCGTKPGDESPHGQKCLYKHTGNDGLITYGTHTTPIMRYVDDLTFTFVEDGAGCLVDVSSLIFYF